MLQFLLFWRATTNKFLESKPENDSKLGEASLSGSWIHGVGHHEARGCDRSRFEIETSWNILEVALHTNHLKFKKEAANSNMYEHVA